MDWLFFALLAYLINAVAFVIDKYLLSAPLPRPFAYAFWVAALSVFALVLIPFGVSTDFGPDYFLISLGSGLSFFIGLNFLYFAIKATDVSIASTMSGVLTAVFSYFLSVSLLGEAAGI